MLSIISKTYPQCNSYEDYSGINQVPKIPWPKPDTKLIIRKDDNGQTVDEISLAPYPDMKFPNQNIFITDANWSVSVGLFQL